MDSSVLDFTYPSGVWEPPWSNDPLIDLALTLSLMNLGITPIREFQTLNILDASSQPMTLFPTLSVNQFFWSNRDVVNNDTPYYDKVRPFLLWVNVDTVQKTMEQSTDWESPLPTLFL